MSNPPPSTKRYCLVCDRVTNFIYDRNIGHSRCEECSNHNGTGVGLGNPVLKHFLEKIKKITDGEDVIKEVGISKKDELNNLRKKVKNQREVIVGLQEKINILEEKNEKNKFEQG